MCFILRGKSLAGLIIHDYLTLHKAVNMTVKEQNVS